MEGVIKTLLTDKKCGFIKSENGVEYFFHSSGLTNIEFNALGVGQQVTFDIGDGKKGPRAENVTA